MPNEEVLQQESNLCPDCGSKCYADEVHGEMVCSNCGLVVSEKLIILTDESRTDERHPFLESDDTVILPQLTFSTKDFAGRKVRGDTLWGLRRTAKTYNLRPPERSIVSMETRIRRLASQHRFTTDLASRAVNLFRKTRKMRLLKKPGLNEWALALLFATCRESGIPITIEDLVGNNVTSKEQKREKKRMRYNVNRYKNLISRALNLRHQLPDVSSYVMYFGGKIDAGPGVVREALTIARAFNRPNSTPHCVAAASLYISLDKWGKPLSQKLFCKATNISEISLRSWTKKLGMEKGKKQSKVPEIDEGLVD